MCRRQGEGDRSHQEPGEEQSPIPGNKSGPLTTSPPFPPPCKQEDRSFSHPSFIYTFHRRRCLRKQTNKRNEPDSQTERSWVTQDFQRENKQKSVPRAIITMFVNHLSLRNRKWCANNKTWAVRICQEGDVSPHGFCTLLSCTQEPPKCSPGEVSGNNFCLIGSTSQAK